MATAPLILARLLGPKLEMKWKRVVFLEVTVNSLEQVFDSPTNGQAFIFQFPRRFLQQDVYAWNTSDAGIRCKRKRIPSH